jgi:hypothetical protein
MVLLGSFVASSGIVLAGGSPRHFENLCPLRRNGASFVPVRQNVSRTRR